jgi:hypothetical protein
MAAMKLPRIAREFTNARDEAANIFPRLDYVTWRPTYEAGSSGRAFGFYDPDELQIGLSPDLEQEDLDRIRGIIRHEFGHAVDELYADATIRYKIPNLPDTGAEARADAIAVALWGDLGYDEDDIQRAGLLRPRPEYLHQ